MKNGLIFQETLYLLAVLFPVREKKFCQSNMFNFCEYVCTKDFNTRKHKVNESSIATMSHTNILRRSESRSLTAAGLVQSVERLTAEREVTSSIPGAGPLLRVLK